MGVGAAGVFTDQGGFDLALDPGPFEVWIFDNVTATAGENRHNVLR